MLKRVPETMRDLIQRKNTEAATRSRRNAEQLNPKNVEGHDWGKRHVAAFNMGMMNKHSHAVVGLLNAAAIYADAHLARFESPIGHDYVLGKGWLAILEGIQTLLNGELGQLDGGTLDGILHSMAKASGVNLETQELGQDLAT